MSVLRSRVERDERGASLVLAIVFMVVAAAIGAGMTAAVTSGVNDTTALAAARNREYAADGAIETSIARVRGIANAGIAAPGCPNIYNPGLNGVPIRVDCANTPSVARTPTGTVVIQNNVTFMACLDQTPSVPCTSANAIINAVINYEANGAQESAFVEAWSVNK